MGNLQKLSLLLAASFWLLAATMAVMAVWLVQPARAETLALPQPPTPQTSTLTIHVAQISPQGGVLRLGLYDAARYPDDNAVPLACADVAAAADTVTITFKDLKPGRYAIESFQDINGNGHMDTNWLGLPLEPYGFSRDARPLLSKPGFDAVAFIVTPGENTQTLHLQNSAPVATAGF